MDHYREPITIEAILANVSAFRLKKVMIRGAFMWAVGRCWIAEDGTSPHSRSFERCILLKAPGLWNRQMLVIAKAGVAVTNMGPSTVCGRLEPSEVTSFPLMLTNLTSLVIDEGPNGKAMDIDLNGLGEIQPSEYNSIMGDTWLSEAGRQTCLETKRRESLMW